MITSSRAAIVGILVLANRSLSAPQLVRLAQPLGLSATNVKSHLTRLVKEGALERRGPPRHATYEPSASQRMIIEGISARISETPNPKWDGAWLMLTLRLPKKRVMRARLRASLWFDGFRPLGPNVFTRPAWPSLWAENRAGFYLDLIGGFCIRGKAVRAEHELAHLYHLNGLHAEGCKLAKWIERRIQRGDSPRAAFVERMKVGGRVAQFIGHDPRLPEAAWGKRRGIAGAVKAFGRFEERLAPKAERFVEEIIGRVD